MSTNKDIWVYMEMSDNEPKRVSLELLAKAQELASKIGSKAVPVWINGMNPVSALTAV